MCDQYKSDGNEFLFCSLDEDHAPAAPEGDHYNALEGVYFDA